MGWKYYKMTPQIKIDKMYSFFSFCYDKGYKFEGEMHYFWECMYINEGEVVASSDERVNILKKGDLIVHKPLELHRFYVDCEEGAEVTVFSFGLEGDAVNLLKNKIFALCDEQRSIIQEMLNLAAEKTEVAKAAKELPDYFELLYPCRENPLYAQRLALSIERLLLCLCEEGEIVNFTDFEDSAVFRKAVDFMKDNISLKISIEDIARNSNISVSTLKRVFGKYSGMGVHKYFLSLKIKAAQGMLGRGMSVSQVAEKLGFASESYFSAAFKRETGISPSKIAKA